LTGLILVYHRRGLLSMAK